MQTNLESMEAHATCGSALMEAHALIDWEGLRERVIELYRRELSRDERQKPVDPLVMFKAVLLGQWHNLSDLKLEEALRLRVDFMDFCGPGLSGNVPDETMLCRFRNRLITSGRLAGLLAGVNAELQSHGLMVEHTGGGVLDASFLRSAVSHENGMDSEPDAENTLIANDGPGMPDGTATLLGSPSRSKIPNDDVDATWVRKGRHSHFGYASY